MKGIIRPRDHLDPALIAGLPDKLRELVFAAEWRLEVVAIGGRNPAARELHVECRLIPNDAARQLEQHAPPHAAPPPPPPPFFDE